MQLTCGFAQVGPDVVQSANCNSRLYISADVQTIEINLNTVFFTINCNPVFRQDGFQISHLRKAVTLYAMPWTDLLH